MVLVKQPRPWAFTKNMVFKPNGKPCLKLGGAMKFLNQCQDDRVGAIDHIKYHQTS